MNPMVLIVEDDRITAELLAGVAADCGFSAEVAADGEAAMQMLSADRWDVVVLDLLLGRNRGVDLLRHLKATQPDLLERTIVVTSPGSAPDCGELHSVWRSMPKPVDFDALSTEMLACVAEHAMTRTQMRPLPR